MKEFDRSMNARLESLARGMDALAFDLKNLHVRTQCSMRKDRKYFLKAISELQEKSEGHARLLLDILCRLDKLEHAQAPIRIDLGSAPVEKPAGMAAETASGNCRIIPFDK